MKKTYLETILRILAFLSGAGLLIWFCIPIFWGVFHIGNGAGILFSILLMAGGIWYVPLRDWMERSIHVRGFRILRRAFWGCVAACAAWAIFLTVCMLSPAPAPPENATVVVLGCKVGSAALNARIDAAANYLRAHPDATAVASGGLGTAETQPEAKAIRDGLERRGISPERILLEGNSTTTKENIAFARAIIEREGLNPEIVVITEQYHEYRALHIAARQGITAYAVPAQTPWYILSASYGRELFALTKFFLFPWMK